MPTRPLPKKKPAQSDSSTVRTLVILTVLILLPSVAFAGYWFYVRDPDWNLALELRDKIQQQRDSGASRDEMRETYGQLRDVAEKLTPAQQRELRNSSDRGRGFERRISEYFELPADQRVAVLDKQIDEFENMRKEWEKRRAQGNNGQARGGEGRGPGGPGGPGDRGNEPRQQRSRTDRLRERLDNSTPQQRAQMSEYFTQMQDRRKQRGLPPIRWGR
jgi:hypothetical protein